MIRITLKGLANFMTGTDSQRRKELQDFKYPKGEGQARAQYYEHAIRAIKRYHRSGNSEEVLDHAAARLQRDAESADGPRKTKLLLNASAIRAYLRNFAPLFGEPQDDLRFSLVFGDVDVKVTPDLHLLYKGSPVLVKLDFATKAARGGLPRIWLQGLYEATINSDHEVKPANLLYLDVRRNKKHKGARVGSRIASDMKAACETIAEMWPNIRRPAT